MRCWIVAAAMLAAGLAAGCTEFGQPGSAATIEGVQGVVLPGWPRAVERHIARACYPGPGPASGALLSVGVDIFGFVRVVGPAVPQEAGPFGARVAYILLSSNCGHFSAPETPVRALIRIYPSP